MAQMNFGLASLLLKGIKTTAVLSKAALEPVSLVAIVATICSNNYLSSHCCSSDLGSIVAACYSNVLNLHCYSAVLQQ
jgi:hypothetical protein